MNVSLNWLKQYLDISGYTPEELASVGTIAGVEVENIEYLAQASKLVIGEIVECVDHPESDHLHVLKVNIGDEVTRRMEALKRTAEIENGDSNYYGTGDEHDLDSFEREGYEVTFDGEDDDFAIDLEDDE